MASVVAANPMLFLYRYAKAKLIHLTKLGINDLLHNGVGPKCDFPKLIMANFKFATIIKHITQYGPSGRNYSDAASTFVKRFQ